MPSAYGLVLCLATVAAAFDAPSYSGYSKIWQDNFAGSAGSLPNSGYWNVITGSLGVNNEWEVYTSNSKNLQLSGGDTLQIVPWKDGTGAHGWSSGRIESKYTFTPKVGEITRLEASLRFGTGSISRKQGIWPAWWMLGDSIRHGTQWPECAEIDVMEQVNGALTGYGTLHCDVSPGGICNEGTGLQGHISMPDQSNFHVWRVEVDRRDSNWLNHKVTWYMDGTQFQQITASRINDGNVWHTIAESPLFFILNNAVGGNWPGYPNSDTLDGYDSMMEVGYVAHYST